MNRPGTASEAPHIRIPGAQFSRISTRRLSVDAAQAYADHSMPAQKMLVTLAGAR